MTEPAPQRSIQRTLVVAGAAVVLLFLVTMCLLTAGPGSGPISPRGGCQSNLKSISMALRAYHDDHGCFPPAYVADANGKPMHSWRVLLVPYLSWGSFGAYDLDEPWDGPGNILLAKSAMPDFRCPAAANDKGPYTNYVAVTGAGTVFDGPKGCRESEITDGLAKTIMLVEIADSDIPWTAPRDLSLETLNLKINADRHGISSNHRDGVNVLFCGGGTYTGDKGEREYGRVEFLSNSTPPEKLKAMFTIQGGEP